MGPVPEDNQTNPDDRDLPNHDSDHEELETPNHILPPAVNDSSSDEDNNSDGEGPANDGYMLLPQEPEEGEEGGGDSGGTFYPQAFPPLSALEGEVLSTGESMTEVRGAGVDVTQAVAEGNVHPVFAANFPDNKVPVHLQVPDLTKMKKDDVLWNQSTPESDRLQLDSAQLSKVRSAMAGFQLPKTHIPDWARHIPEDQWRQQLVDRLTPGCVTSGAPATTTTTTRTSASSSGGPGKLRNDASGTEKNEDVGKKDCEQPGASSGT